MAMLQESQTTSAVLLIRPAGFLSNPQTAESNAFQQAATLSAEDLQTQALAEWQGLVELLQDAGVKTIVFDDTDQPAKPDALYPNNWVSFHADGTVVLYPLEAENRRHERRIDIIESLSRDHGYSVRRIIDLSLLEQEGVFVESTGSMVLDRVNRVAYACLSSRTHTKGLASFGQQLGYEMVVFDARDGNGKAIYHTNLLMSIGNKFAIVCLEAIADNKQRDAVRSRLNSSGRTVIAISIEQINQSVGNVLELKTTDDNPILVMSGRAQRAFNATQWSAITSLAEPLVADLDTIERAGGGSARCMIAEVHLPAHT